MIGHTARVTVGCTDSARTGSYPYSWDYTAPIYHTRYVLTPDQSHIRILWDMIYHKLPETGSYRLCITRGAPQILSLIWLWGVVDKPRIRPIKRIPVSTAWQCTASPAWDTPTLVVENANTGFLTALLPLAMVGFHTYADTNMMSGLCMSLRGSCRSDFSCSRSQWCIVSGSGHHPFRSTKHPR